MSLGPRLGIWVLLVVLGVALFGLGLAAESRRAWIALLAGYVFIAPLSAGLITWSAIVKASNGAWPGRLERLPLAALGCAPLSLGTLVLLWAFSGAWAPWPTEQLPQGVWFNVHFLFARNLALQLLFWLLAWHYNRRRREGQARAVASWLVLCYAVVFSLFGFDLIMGLEPHWLSTIFGLYVSITGLYAAVAAWAFFSALGGKPLGPQREKRRTSQFHPHSRLHDVGKLVFAFCLLSTYMLFCQLLPIWYENLPHETLFLLPRMQTSGWKWVSVALLVLIYLGPLLYLLPIPVKRTPWMLAGATLVILGGLWLERLWLVLPSFSIESLTLADFGGLAALGGLCGLGVEAMLPRVPAELPGEAGRE